MDDLIGVGRLLETRLVSDCALVGFGHIEGPPPESPPMAAMMQAMIVIMTIAIILESFP